MSIKSALYWIWQLPQNLLALLLAFVLLAKRRDHDSGAVLFYNDVLPAGCALGEYILLSQAASAQVIAHECGHVRQSRMLGPLYLIVIGMPSLLHNLIWRWCGGRWEYYSFWTERWADKLGGIER